MDSCPCHPATERGWRSPIMSKFYTGVRMSKSFSGEWVENDPSLYEFSLDGTFPGAKYTFSQLSGDSGFNTVPTYDASGGGSSQNYPGSFSISAKIKSEPWVSMETVGSHKRDEPAQVAYLGLQVGAPTFDIQAVRVLSESQGCGDPADRPAIYKGTFTAYYQVDKHQMYNNQKTGGSNVSSNRIDQKYSDTTYGTSIFKNQCI